MKRLLIHGVLVMAGLLVAGERRVHAQAAPNVLGSYRGFFRSVDDPGSRGTVDLKVTQQMGSNFSGQLTMVSNGLPLPFSFMGTVDAAGIFRGTGRGEAGQVAFLGGFRDLGGGAAYVTGGYSFVPTAGGAMRGIAIVLRNFVEDPNQMPPNVNGNWRGTFTSARSVNPGPCRLLVQQDFDSSGAPGTGFTGQLFLGEQSLDVIATIKGGGQFFLIGQGVAAVAVAQGVLVNPGPCRASYVLAFTDGSTDFGTWEINPMPR